MMARKIYCGTCATWICHQKSRCTISEEKACKYQKYSLSLPPISITDQNRLPMYMQTSTYQQEPHYYPYGGVMGESIMAEKNLNVSSYLFSRILFPFLLFILSIIPIFSQNRVIQGKVIDEMERQPIIGAHIIINDSIKVGETGIDGCFQFETPLSINKLSFQYFGMEDADLKLSDNCNYIELIMIYMPTYDFMSFRKINKIRKRRYKNLPTLHNKAYKEGVFLFPDVCYIQVFSEMNSRDGESGTE